MTLASLATAVKPEWLQEMFPQLIRNGVEHIYDRTHKRVDAIRLVRFIDITIAREHQREVDPTESGRALADAFGQGFFELPNLTHDVKQLIARVYFLSHAVPELEMAVSLTDGWARYWFRGEMLPLPGELLRSRDRANHLISPPQ